MFLLWFYPWSYLRNVYASSCKSALFSHAVHVFRNLFWKICPLFGQILITCLKCSRASFSPPSIFREKMRWGRGWIYSINVNVLKNVNGTLFNLFSPNFPFMDKPCSSFLLAKHVKNTCGRVTFLGTGHRLAYLFKMSLFHKYFSHVLLVKAN